MSRENRSLRRCAIAFVAVAALVAVSASAATDGSWQGEARDAWISGKIEAAYALNRYLNPFEIDTTVTSGVVHLQGAVESQIDKDLAEEIAIGTDGVTGVKNDLKVERGTKKKAKSADRSFGQVVDDATTTARVKTALLANQSTGGLAIDVDTEAGRVSLTGAVESKQEAQLAERIASNTEGVKEVENELKITSR